MATQTEFLAAAPNSGTQVTIGATARTWMSPTGVYVVDKSGAAPPGSTIRPFVQVCS